MQMAPNGLFPVINHMLLDSHFYIQVRNASMSHYCQSEIFCISLTSVY
jgi:hypothetical protein